MTIYLMIYELKIIIADLPRLVLLFVEQPEHHVNNRIELNKID